MSEETSLVKDQKDKIITSENKLKNKVNKIKDFLKDKNNRKKIIVVSIIILLLVIAIVCVLFSKNKYDNEPFYIQSIEKKSKGFYAKNHDKFIVKTSKDSLELVQNHLYIEPAVNYNIKEVSKNTYEVDVKDMPSDSIINFKNVENEVVEDKWAFQTTKDLTVTSTYPSNNTSDINTNSVIEIVFSYPDVHDINSSVTIDPPIEGSFVKNGRVWMLKPTSPLKENQTYTVTINDSIKNASEKLKESYKFTFSTFKSNQVNTTTTSKIIKYNSNTIDNIATFKTSDKPLFRTKEDISRVEILKLSNSNEFKKYIENDSTYKANPIGNVDFTKLDNNLYQVNRNFENGYYIINAYLSSGELSFSIPVQINNLQAYVMTTQNDILVWVNSNNSLLENVNIQYGNNSVKTDKDGLAIINNYNQKNDKIKYLTIGKDNPIFVGLENEDNTQIPNAYIYTDRPLYKNTDDINIFGYVPLKYFEEKYNKNDFVLSFNEENIPFELKDDGSFITKYHLDNYKDSDYTVLLKYKDKTIATRYITVKKYEKEMYNFTIDAEKNYVKAGKDFVFSVTVEHISGVKVPGKEIQAICNEKVYRTVTDDSGVATFKIPTTFNNDETSIISVENVQIKSTLTESSQKGEYIYFYVINRYLDKVPSNYDKKNKVFSSELYNLSDTKNIKTINWDKSVIRDTKYNGNIKIKLVETETTKSIKEYSYNEITKQNVPIYDYNSVETVVKEDNYTVKDGKINYKINYNYKNDTATKSYSYSLELYVNDKNGIRAKYNEYLSTKNNSANINGYLSEDYYHYYPIEYNLYNYYLYPEEKSYFVNDKIDREIYNYNGNKETIKNKLLLIKYKNSIINKSIINNNSKIETEFNDSDRPGVNIAGAYLKDGVFYRLPKEYLDYDHNNSKLDISITPNKKTYVPQEEVELTIKVAKNKKGIKSRVNISVVDEGVFNAAEDYTNILEGIYNDKHYYQYLYSTYRDYSLYYLDGGAGSTSGGPRADFGDTIYFENVETDANGNAKVKFKLNDSITSFRITAHAVTDDVDVGATHTNIESSLPISISFTEPRGLKITDDVVLNALGIGSTKENIVYEFTLNGNKKKITKQGKISETVYANFGKLKAGNYTAIIKAKAGNETDVVKFNFTVNKTQTETSIKNGGLISDLKTINPTKNPIKLEFMHKSFMNYDKYLNIIKNTLEDRLDIIFTYNNALKYENKYIGLNNNTEIGDITRFKKEDGYKYLTGEDISYVLTALLGYYDESFRLDKSKYYEKLTDESAVNRMHAYLVLASQKEPILDDLVNDHALLSSSNINELALAYVFLGDYKSANELYKNIDDIGVKTYLSTFLDKRNAARNIDNLYNKDPANRYLYFSIISYFENNSVDLNKEEKVIVTYGDKRKEVVVSPLTKKYLTIYQKDLKELKIKSESKDIYINYYYEGSIDEIENKEENIKISMNSKDLKLGEIYSLRIDASKASNNERLTLFLPNGLRLADLPTSNNVSVTSVSPEKIYVYFLNENTRIADIKLYASSIGNYKIEPIIMKQGDSYQVSNQIEVNIK